MTPAETLDATGEVKLRVSLLCDDGGVACRQTVGRPSAFASGIVQGRTELVLIDDGRYVMPHF
jgi:hypothetical protein